MGRTVVLAYAGVGGHRLGNDDLMDLLEFNPRGCPKGRWELQNMVRALISP